MKLIAQHTIVHDGKTYARGEPLDVKKAADAERLVRLGAALPAGEPGPAQGEMLPPEPPGA